MSKFRYETLESHLRKQIQTKRFQPGDKLPSVRNLCENHQLSKATVLHALHRLEADQLIFAVPKTGYFVARNETRQTAPKKILTPSTPALVNVPDIFRDIMSRSAAFDILPAAGSAPASSHLINLHRMISRCARTHPEQKANYYDEPKGNYGLRASLAELYRQRELIVSTDDICITAGCQHALFLALMASCKPGDTVAIESPSFYGALQLLEQLELHVIEISTDPVTGIDLEDLEEKIQNWPIKACLVTPNFSTPTGAKMPLEHQQKLVEMANRHAFYVIEDDIYGEMRFTNDVCPPLKSQQQSDRVILCSSFSKSLSRDLRIGWIMGGQLHDKIVQLKLVTQLASPQSPQEGLANFIENGHFRRFVNQQSQRLREQRDSLLEELKQLSHNDIRYTKPEGGLSCWIELPDHVNTQKKYQLLLEKGVILTPGVLFSAHGLYHNYLRLSFSQPLTERRLAALHQLFQTLLK